MVVCWFFFFQAEDGIRDLVRSRGLGDVYKRQGYNASVRCDIRETTNGRPARPKSCELDYGTAYGLSLIHI